MVKVSIVIPIYNEEVLIEEWLDNIRKQTDTPDEVLLIDGGSRDNTVRIIKEYVKKHDMNYVKILETNISGIGKSRHVGLEKTIGEFVITGDADDFYSETFVEEVRKKAEDPDVYLILNKRPYNYSKDLWGRINQRRRQFYDQTTRYVFRKSIALTCGGYKPFEIVDTEYELADNIERYAKEKRKKIEKIGATMNHQLTDEGFKEHLWKSMDRDGVSLLRRIALIPQNLLYRIKLLLMSLGVFSMTLFLVISPILYLLLSDSVLIIDALILSTFLAFILISGTLRMIQSKKYDVINYLIPILALIEKVYIFLGVLKSLTGKKFGG